MEQFKERRRHDEETAVKIGKLEVRMETMEHWIQDIERRIVFRLDAIDTNIALVKAGMSEHKGAKAMAQWMIISMVGFLGVLGGFFTWLLSRLPVH